MMASVTIAKHGDTVSEAVGPKTGTWSSSGTTVQRDKAKEEKMEIRTTEDIKEATKEDIKEDLKAEEDGTKRDQAKEVKRAKEEPTGSTHQPRTLGMDSMEG